MIQRALINVQGPDGCGKTAFVEALLAACDAPIIVGTLHSGRQCATHTGVVAPT